MKIAFRVNIGQSIGIGHAKRCLSLAKELKLLDANCIFIFNQKNSYIESQFKEFPTYILQMSDSEENPELQPKEQLEKQDARQFIATLTKIDFVPDWVIIDSYILSYHWEKVLKDLDHKVVVIDDNNVNQHECDVLIDQKYDGINTLERYKDLVPEDCLRVLGPNFAMLASEYRTIEEHRLTKIYQPHQKFKILFSIGGGGDFKPYKELFEELINNNLYELQVVIGPYAKNFDFLKDLTIQKSNLILHFSPSSLKDLYLDTHLFLGALGTSLYEISATKTPALTFSIAKNQSNNLNDLEKLGHYFHFNSLEQSQLSSLLPIIENFKSQYARLTELKNSAPISIDNKGCLRLAKILCHPEKFEPVNYSVNIGTEKFLYSKNDHHILKINDTFINHYLNCRNLEKNSQNMSVRNEISPLEHYRWWFSNTRELYLLRKKSAPFLYLWHQLKVINNKEFLIGGWFICQQETGFDSAILALDWQLKYTKEIYPNAKWLAVIKKDNQFVNMLNKYMGFTQTSANSDEHAATQTFFPFASPDEFNFVLK